MSNTPKKSNRKWSVLLIVIIIIISYINDPGAENPSLEGSTLRSGYVYIELQSGGKLGVVQKSSQNPSAGGCTADGFWSQNGDKVFISNIQSHCGSEDYQFLNGIYIQKGKCIEKGEDSYCLGPWLDQN